MSHALSDIVRDIEIIQGMSAVPTILQVVAQITGMRFTAVARVTDEKWVACAVHDKIAFGLTPGNELVLESTICNDIRQHHNAVLFGHASQHPIFSSHPTPKLYGFESYASIPIFLSNGEFWGTLCAIDPVPAKLDDPSILKTMELFAQLIAAQYETEDRLKQSGAELLNAQEGGKLRDQFIAVLGHDLRNPISAIAMTAAVLESKVSDASGRRLVDAIKRSCARMGLLVNDVLDFARGTLGAGIPVTLRQERNLAESLAFVVSEIQTLHPTRAFVSTIDIAGPVRADKERLGQLLGNLLSNAATHGLPDAPIGVSLITDAAGFELSVSNGGVIPEDQMAQIFQPFYRLESEGKDGLGLGLFIAAEIAKAHGSLLQATSTQENGTRFFMRIEATSASYLRPPPARRGR